jgi:branched-subunit amino acid aminotransferase/4-amino-4-deoxychorismate lyase
MHKFISFNGEICSPADANVPALSSAALYGWGIFTSLAIYDGHPFLWEKHWGRLRQYAEAVGIDISQVLERDVYLDLLAVIYANKLADARARITFFDNSAGFWNCAASDQTNVMIATADFRDLPDDFRLTVSPYRLNSSSALVGIKSCNYLENLLAWEKAKEAGFDEAARLNERGEVTSGCIANIFWVKGGRLYTPSLNTGALSGTTRAHVLELAREEGIECLEVEAPLSMLLAADECFLTSAGVGIRNIAQVDDTHYHSSEFAARFERSVTTLDKVFR